MGQKERHVTHIPY